MAFSFYSCEKEVIDPIQEESTVNTDEVQLKAEESEEYEVIEDYEYPEVEYTYYESKEDFDNIVLDRLSMIGNLSQSTGSTHAFAITQSGSGYGISNTVNLGSGVVGNGSSGSNFMMGGYGHIAAMYNAMFGLQQPCAWLQSQSSVHYVYDEGC
ncbi:MAG: hypothetical protein AB8B56_19680 [Crocinitomicaceae bacterium]